MENKEEKPILLDEISPQKPENKPENEPNLENKNPEKKSKKEKIKEKKEEKLIPKEITKEVIPKKPRKPYTKRQKSETITITENMKLDNKPFYKKPEFIFGCAVGFAGLAFLAYKIMKIMGKMKNNEEFISEEEANFLELENEESPESENNG